MMYIKMLEPATASIAVYLITRGTTRIDKHKRLMERNPFYIKKKICKWILRNKDEVVNSIIDETNDFMMDSFNIIHLKSFDPSIFMIVYLILLMIVIIF